MGGAGPLERLLCFPVYPGPLADDEGLHNPRVTGPCALDKTPNPLPQALYAPQDAGLAFLDLDYEGLVLHKAGREYATEGKKTPEVELPRVSEVVRLPEV